MFIYSIFDKKAVSFGPLFISENNDTAKRSVVSSLYDESLLSRFPSDYSLYCLGKFDSDTGDVSGISPVEFVCEVLSLLKVDKNSKSD